MKSYFYVSRINSIWTIMRDNVIYGEYEDKDEALRHGHLLAMRARTSCNLHESNITIGETGEGLAS